MTLLAVLVSMWLHPDGYSVFGVIGIIAGTVVAPWLATLVAAVMSSGMMEDKKLSSVNIAKF